MANNTIHDFDLNKLPNELPSSEANSNPEDPKKEVVMTVRSRDRILGRVTVQKPPNKPICKIENAKSQKIEPSVASPSPVNDGAGVDERGTSSEMKKKAKATAPEDPQEPEPKLPCYLLTKEEIEEELFGPAKPLRRRLKRETAPQEKKPIPKVAETVINSASPEVHGSSTEPKRHRGKKMMSGV